MFTMIRRWRLSIGPATALLAWASMLAVSPALAQDYPTKPIRIICAFPPGNAADIVARVLSEYLAPRLGQPVLVDNRAGASGTLAAVAVARSAPDGHTLLMTSTSFAINPAILANMPYDLEKDFIPVSLVNSIPAVLIVNKAFPATTPQELIAELKRNPDKYTYGHPGTGTMQNLTMKLFMTETGVAVREVPYKGSVQAVTDIIGGSLDMMFESGNAASAFVKGDRVKAIVTSGPARYFGMPGVPTVKEAGLAFTVLGWTGLVAPAGTPPAVVNRLNREVKEILAIPQVKERMVSMGFDVYEQLSPDHVAKQIRSESARWISVAKQANIKKE